MSRRARQHKGQDLAAPSDQQRPRDGADGQAPVGPAADGPAADGPAPERPAPERPGRRPARAGVLEGAGGGWQAGSGHMPGAPIPGPPISGRPWSVWCSACWRSGPALGSGFVLSYDMVFVPDPPVGYADLGYAAARRARCPATWSSRWRPR